MRMGRAVPDGALAARVTELRDEALTIVRPAHIERRFPIVEGNIVSGSVRLVLAGTLARHLAGCRAAYLACGTLGTGFDAFQRRVSATSGADALIVQAIGAALIEKLMDTVEAEIRRELPPNETLVSRYSPGYGDHPAAMLEAGVAYATEQIIDLFANGVNAVHIYTMNKPEVAGRIMANLRNIVGG